MKQQACDLREIPIESPSHQRPNYGVQPERHTNMEHPASPNANEIQNRVNPPHHVQPAQSNQWPSLEHAQPAKPGQANTRRGHGRRGQTKPTPRGRALPGPSHARPSQAGPSSTRPSQTKAKPRGAKPGGAKPGETNPIAGRRSSIPNPPSSARPIPDKATIAGAKPSWRQPN